MMNGAHSRLSAVNERLQTADLIVSRHRVMKLTACVMDGRLPHAVACTSFGDEQRAPVCFSACVRIFEMPVGGLICVSVFSIHVCERYFLFYLFMSLQLRVCFPACKRRTV